MKINKEKKIITPILNFLNPDYIYIPYDKDNDKLLKEIGSNILKDEELLIHDSKTICSPISGKIMGTTESILLDNKNCMCLVLENDFKEKIVKKIGAAKYINEYDKNDFLDLMSKYYSDIDFKDDIKTFIISGIDFDPYEKTYSFLINEYTSKILEAIDAISTILNIDNTIFAVSSRDNLNVVNLTNNIGTYPNIKLKYVQYSYPIGYKDILINQILSKKEKKENYLYMNIKDVFNIYNILKKKKPINENIITISGDSISKSYVVRVKNGTSIGDIIKNVCKITNEKYSIVVNGLIGGDTISSLNNIVTPKINSIFLNTTNKDVEKKCINCGLCNLKCPVGLNPKYIMEHKYADKSKCINCGLCTYICPSKINFKKYLGGHDEK